MFALPKSKYNLSFFSPFERLIFCAEIVFHCLSVGGKSICANISPDSSVMLTLELVADSLLYRISILYSFVRLIVNVYWSHSPFSVFRVRQNQLSSAYNLPEESKTFQINIFAFRIDNFLSLSF